MKLSQVFESALIDSILKLAVIPVACAHFPTQILPSSQKNCHCLSLSVEEVQTFLSLIAEERSSESLMERRELKRFSGVTAVEAVQL